MEKYYDHFDFRPKLNKTKQYEMNFNERNEIYQRNLQEKKQNIIDENILYDNKTGQRLFSPKILRNSKSQVLQI